MTPCDFQKYLKQLFSGKIYVWMVQKIAAFAYNL